MPWNPQGGGGGGQGPWGHGPSGGPRPPDIEEMLRRGQDSFKKFIPSGAGGSKGLFLIILAAIGIWLASGFYRVQPGVEGVELLFGKFVNTTTPGLNYWAPAPIGQVYKPNVERTNQITVGFRGSTDQSQGSGTRDVPKESLMLTGDQNIIDVDFVVQWRIKNAADYLFNIRDQETTLRAASESAMREIIGQTSLEGAITSKRGEVQVRTKKLLQEILDSYGAGVFIADLKLLKVDPPVQVIDAFNDVQRAKQDRERQQNEADTYRNDIVPRAKGDAARIVQGAMAYKEKVIKEAEGEAQRFLSVYNTYLAAKDVTKRRLYLEAWEEIFKSVDKVIIDNKAGGKGVVPYLPLPEIRKRVNAARGGKK
ncbi:MAG TPA: FtsH protease activity modulator HflK [Alphaproteobacteria bacterium]|nr:FtsH protease activity modulator HflK [Alphaproteobacteria bacterium]